MYIINFSVLLFCIVYTNNAFCKMQPIVLVHGGAGDIPDSRVPNKIAGVKAAAKAGYKVLQEGGSAIDAVVSAVRLMEDDPVFNAGYGSVLNLDGDVEMDASIMVGSDLAAGAVTVIKDIAHPISLARLVMEKTPHVVLAAEGAKRFAIDQGIEILPPGSLVTESALEALKHFKEHGGIQTEIFRKKSEVDTVGAVAIDADGHVVAATSTGGINGKMVGRCSDTSQIGSGSYADDNLGAVSTTGHGETIMKVCLAHTIIKAIENGKLAQDATHDSIKAMTARLNNTAGAITISYTGDVGIAFSSNRMAWAYQKENKIHFGIEHDQHDIESIPQK